MSVIKKILKGLLLFLLLSTEGQSAVFVNQAGYFTTNLKLAYTDHAAGTFSLIDLKDNSTVFSGAVVLRVADDPSTGLDVYVMDFSSFQHSGSFKIRLQDGEESVPFEISDSVFSMLAIKTLKGLYFQRCGMALETSYAGPYTHGICHSADALYHSTCQASGYKNVKGGWHDAGDYGKYVVPAANALSYLLMLAEYFPTYLNSDHLNIPESDNHIPDILDESRYELNWLLTMQDSSSGGVYFKVTTKDFVGFIMPDESHDARYIYQIASTATADFAAILARAYRVYQNYDSAFASRCLTAAQNAWHYLQMHPDIVPPGGFQNPDDTETGEYGDDDDRDERLWAAAELFESTGETPYNDYFRAHYQDEGIIQEQTSWEYVKPLAQITYLKSKQAHADETVKSQISNALNSYASDQVNLSDSDGFHVAMEGWEYYWGSNSVALNKAIILIFMYEETGNSSYFETALHQLNYILGCNAHNMTFVTDVGSQSPLHIHHAPSIADGVDAPVPGLMVGGPNRYLDDPVLQFHFNSQTPPALCYVDDQESYASNEIAIYWNTPLVFVSAYFNQGQGKTSIVQEPLSVKSFCLAQNYPNPFNNQTVIPFYLNKKGRVDITIFDLSGKQIRRLVSGDFSAGSHIVRWKGLDNKGHTIASGIYFYRLKWAGGQQIKKMVLLR